MSLLRQYQVLGVAVLVALLYTLFVHPGLTSLLLDLRFLHEARMSQQAQHPPEAPK